MSSRKNVGFFSVSLHLTQKGEENAVILPDLEFEKVEIENTGVEE